MPYFAGENVERGPTTPHQKRLLPNFNRQATSHSDTFRRSDAVRAVHRAFHCQGVGLVRLDQALAVVAVHRLLGHESSIVIGGFSGRGSTRLAWILVLSDRCLIVWQRHKSGFYH